MFFSKVWAVFVILSAVLLTSNASSIDRRSAPKSALYAQKVNKCRDIIRNEYLFCKAFLSGSGNDAGGKDVTVTRTDSYVIVQSYRCFPKATDTNTYEGQYAGKRSLAAPTAAVEYQRRHGPLWSLLATFSIDIIKDACVSAFPSLSPSKTVSVLPTYSLYDKNVGAECGQQR